LGSSFWSPSQKIGIGEQVPYLGRLRFQTGTAEDEMQNSNTYRQYADDCRRIAETMNAKDKAIMLEMAKVWEERAEDAERVEKNKARSHLS
jgi:hypothetical protein